MLQFSEAYYYICRCRRPTGAHIIYSVFTMV